MSRGRLEGRESAAGAAFGAGEGDLGDRLAAIGVDTGYPVVAEEGAGGEAALGIGFAAAAGPPFFADELVEGEVGGLGG